MAVFYTVLMVSQLAMIAAAYCPSLLFRLPAAAEAAAMAAGVVGAAAEGSSAAEAVAAVGVSDPLLRLVKYAFGSGFFVAAFICNCLKTAADRHHAWAPQNRCALSASCHPPAPCLRPCMSITCHVRQRPATTGHDHKGLNTSAGTTVVAASEPCTC